MWTLRGVTSEQYDELYTGTAAAEVKELFTREPDSDEDAIINFFPSKLWRMNSGIYKIENKQGDLIPFHMNYAQHFVYSRLLRHPRCLIGKSRQTGQSTWWLLYALDEILTRDNFKAGLMAQGLDEASQLKERIERAWDNLPSLLVDFLGLKCITRNTKEFALNNDSKIYIATSFRSGTLQFLHISEFAKISVKYPERAKETISGSMQAIRGGLPIILESTSEGPTGKFFEMWKSAERHDGALSPKDFTTVFLPWMSDPDCRINVRQRITKEAEEYFERLINEYYEWKGERLELEKEQKWWWIAQMREFDEDMDMMSKEYPGTPTEMFHSVKDGSYYGRLYRKYVIGKNRLQQDIYEPTLPVDVAIDLGMNDQLVMVFYQLVGPELHIIDEYVNSGEGLEHYVGVMRAKGYSIRAVYVPHDANVRELGTGKSRAQILRELGVPARILVRTKSVLDDIELVRKALPYMWFNKDSTTYLQACMEGYSKEWDERLGVFKDRPRHDDFSHGADALRYMVKSLEWRLNNNVKGARMKFRSNVVDGIALP